MVRLDLDRCPIRPLDRVSRIRSVTALAILLALGPSAALAQTTTVTVVVDGNGLVTSQDGAISCAPDCAESYALNTAVTLVAAAASGSVFVGWSGSCAGTGSCVLVASNDRSATATFAVAGRDLVTTSASGAPAAAWPGATFTLTDTARNVGTLDAAASTTRYYLSLDAVKNSADLRLSGTRTVPILASLMASTGSAAVTVPSAAAPGTYRVLVCADDTAVVSEVSNANNCVAAPGTTRIVLPDLTTTSISNPPAHVAPGASFSVSDTTQNIATEALAPATTTRYYLSVDDARNSGDILLSGTRPVPALAAGASSAGVRTVTVPTSAALGSYRVLSCADDTAVAKDADRASNSCKASSASVVIGLPDLTALSITTTAIEVAVGGSFSVTDSVRNVGAVVAAKSTTTYRLSSDTIPDTADVQLTGTRSVNTLAAGASSTGSKTVKVPSSVPAGSYHVIACADALLKVREVSEANNCTATGATIRVRPSRPDHDDGHLQPGTHRPGPGRQRHRGCDQRRDDYGGREYAALLPVLERGPRRCGHAPQRDWCVADTGAGDHIDGRGHGRHSSHHAWRHVPHPGLRRRPGEGGRERRGKQLHRRWGVQGQSPP